MSEEKNVFSKRDNSFSYADPLENLSSDNDKASLQNVHDGTIEESVQGRKLGIVDKLLGIPHARINIAFITIVLIFILILINMFWFSVPLAQESLIGLLGTIIGYVFGKGL